MSQRPARPLSPHLGIYRWSPQMAMSIIHRATGFILSTAGLLVLLWWLAALGGDSEAYETFQRYVVSAGENATGAQTASNWFFRLLGLVLLYSFFQHLFSGVRHLLLDTGAGYGVNTNRTWAWAAFIAAFFATASVALVVISRFLGV